MYRDRHLALVVGVAMLVIASPTQAQPWRTTGEYQRQVDANADGRVSQDEYIAWMSYGFDSMDRNRDGVLQAVEQPGGRGKLLTRAEHHANLVARFKRQDTDRSGYLSAKELSAPPR